MPTAAIYARSPRPARGRSRRSRGQTAALLVHAEQRGLEVPPEWVFEDEGYPGATPGLRQNRDSSLLSNAPTSWSDATRPRWPSPGARIQQQTYWDI